MQKETIFSKEEYQRRIRNTKAMMDKAFFSHPLPARCTVAVAGLDAGLDVEIEVIAAAP